MQKIVVFTGAGMSAESGIRTFRDSNGLWEEYRIEDVATPEAWQRNPQLVTSFYNARRKNILEAKPNNAHYSLAELEPKFDVQIITQNIDDLHERAGSSKVLHLHGEIVKLRSEIDASLIYPISDWKVSAEQKNELGHRLRPHIVWFGEPVPKMDEAIIQTMQADIFIVIGTSLEVYPAAGLINYVPEKTIKYYIDPKAATLPSMKKIHLIKESAGHAVPLIINKLLSNV